MFNKKLKAKNADLELALRTALVGLSEQKEMVEEYTDCVMDSNMNDAADRLYEYKQRNSYLSAYLSHVLDVNTDSK